MLGMKVIAWIVAVEVLGIASGLLTASSIPGWYSSLSEPPGTPPNWIFGPVWSVLYAMIGVAGAFLWHRGEASPARLIARRWFIGQFLLNLAWTPVFFGTHQMALALVVIVALFGSISMTIRTAAGFDRVVAGLLLPYLCWVGYATYLNAGFLVLNR